MMFFDPDRPVSFQTDRQFRKSIHLSIETPSDVNTCASPHDLGGSHSPQDLGTPLSPLSPSALSPSDRFLSCGRGSWTQYGDRSSHDVLRPLIGCAAPVEAPPRSEQDTEADVSRSHVEALRRTTVALERVVATAAEGPEDAALTSSSQAAQVDHSTDASSPKRDLVDGVSVPNSPSPTTSRTNLEVWLEQRGLGKFTEKITSLGARRISDLAHLDQDDFDQMGMSYDEQADVRVVIG